MRFKIDWASHIVGSKFTVFALLYFVFEGNFPSTSPQGAYFNGGFFCVTGLEGLYLEGPIHGGAYFRNFSVCTIEIASITMTTTLTTATTSTTATTTTTSTTTTTATTTTTVTARTTSTLIDHTVVTVVEQLNRKPFNWCDVIPRHSITALKYELSFDSAPEH